MKKIFYFIIILVWVSSCTKPYRVSPSSHHITQFTDAYQLSAQAGYRNVHGAFSVSKHVAVKGSYFSRFVDSDNTMENYFAKGKDKSIIRGGNEDYEFGLAYFNTNEREQRYHEIYLGAGKGRTQFSKNFGRIHWLDHKEYIGTFNSDNYSLFLQGTVSPLEFNSNNNGNSFNIYLSGKLKWIMLNNIRGENLQHFRYDDFGYKNPVQRDFLLLPQLSCTFRYQTRLFYIQQQMGYSYKNKYRDSSFKKLWLEISAGFFLDFRHPLNRLGSGRPLSSEI